MKKYLECINPLPYHCIKFHSNQKNQMKKNVIVFADKYQGIDWVLDTFNDQFVHPDKADLNEEKFWIEGTEIPDWVTEIAIKDFGFSEWPELVSKYLKVQVYEVETFDIHFNDSENSNNKGFKESFAYCLDYIDRNAGSYFKNFPNGFVSIVCNETGYMVFGKSFTTESYK